MYMSDLLNGDDVCVCVCVCARESVSASTHLKERNDRWKWKELEQPWWIRLSWRMTPRKVMVRLQVCVCVCGCVDNHIWLHLRQWHFLLSFWLKYWVFQALNVDFCDPMVLPNGLSGLWCDDLCCHKDIKHIKANVTFVSLMSFFTVHFQHQLVSQCSCFHIYFKALMHSFYCFIHAKQNEVDAACWCWKTISRIGFFWKHCD